MRIGDLKTPFLLQAQKAEGWETIGVLWGRMELAGEGDPFSRRVIARARPDLEVKTGLRLSRGERTFLIRAVFAPDEGTRWLNLLVEEDVSLG